MATPEGDDFNFFTKIFDTVNRLLLGGDKSETQVFLMLLPGYSVNPDNFNPAHNEDAFAHEAEFFHKFMPNVDNHYVPSGQFLNTLSDIFATAVRLPKSELPPKELKDTLADLDVQIKGASAKVNEARKVFQDQSKETADLYKPYKDYLSQPNLSPEDRLKKLRELAGDADLVSSNRQLAGAKMDLNAARLEADKLRAKRLVLSEANLDLAWQSAFESYKDGESPYFLQPGKNYLRVKTEPDTWWKAFEADYDPDAEGAKDLSKLSWLEASVQHSHGEKATSEKLSKISASAEASYGGLFYSGSAKGGFDKSSGNKAASTKDSSFSLSFKLARVSISWPWFGGLSFFLHQPGVGIASTPVGALSSGTLHTSNDNSKTFPLMVTDMIIARKVKLEVTNGSSSMTDSFSKLSTTAEAKVGFGPFSAKGNFSSDTSSSDTSATWDSSKNTLSIDKPQIIGFVASVVPKFPNKGYDQ